MPPPRSPERLALAVAVLGIHHSVSNLSRGSASPADSRPSGAPGGAVTVPLIPVSRRASSLTRSVKTARQHGGMYHTIAPKCQTQFVPEKARNKGDSRPSGGRSAAVPAPTRRRPGSSSAAWPLTSASLGLLQPRDRQPRLAREAISSTSRAASTASTAAARSGATFTGWLAPPGRSSPWPRPLQHGRDRPSTQMPRPGSRSARSGTHPPSGPSTKRISPSFGPLVAGDDAAPLGLIPFLHPAPARHESRLGLRPRSSASLALALVLGFLGAASRSAGSTQPSCTRAFMTSVLRLLEAHVELLEQALVLDPLAVDGGVAAGELPVGAACEVLERLDAVLGEAPRSSAARALRNRTGSAPPPSRGHAPGPGR